MKRVLASAFTAIVLAASGVAATSATASAAPDGARAFRCKVAWSDKNTVGVKCTGGGSFFAAAECKNGRTAQGATAAAGTISYAYCTSLNSSLKKPINAWGVQA